MFLARRILGALSGLLLLHLTLQASGSLCAMQAHASHDTAAHALHGEMDGMSLDATVLATGTRLASDATDMGSGNCGAPVRGDGCGSPWVPGQCSAMSTCGVSAAVAAAVGIHISPRAIALVSLSPALVHSGPTLAPELPPPRA